MPYRILALKPTGVAAPYVISDLAEALSDLGHTVHVVELTELLKLPVNSCVEVISSINPDFAIAYGASGLIQLQTGSRVTNLLTELDIPFACLICDNPELIMTALKWAQSPLMQLFVWDEVYAAELKAAGFKNVFPFALATNPRRFLLREISHEAVARFAVPLAFVGSLPDDESIHKLYAGLSFPALLDAVLKIRRAHPEWSCRQCIVALGNELDPGARKELEAYMEGPDFEQFNLLVHWRLTYERRVRIVRLLELEGIAVWGNRAWLKVLRDAGTYRGSIDYDTETPILYQVASIIIDIPSAQLLTAVNQRVFDVLAAGGFVLTNYQRDLEKFFEVGREIVCYRTPNELLKLVRHFLSHPEERKEVANAGRARVLRDHTYKERAEELLEVMESILASRRMEVPIILSTYARPVSCSTLKPEVMKPLKILRFEVRR
ncbi:MAG: CgeB family protein, partial [Desulfotomaculales bacterium]